MSNLNIMQTYKEDILKVFKNHYKILSAKNLNLSFSQVLFATLDELNLSSKNNHDTFFLENWFNQIHYQSFVNQLMVKTKFNELIFHAHNSAQIYNQLGQNHYELSELTKDDYQLSLEIFALKNNISWNYSEPFASFYANINQQNFRITLIHFSTSANSTSKLFIRAIHTLPPTLSMFNLPDHLNQKLAELVGTKKNILISGSTGSGKTTLMRALLNEIDKDEHIVILEDTHEIITTSNNQTSMLASNRQNNKSLKDYCAYALRMSPERLIIGEMRSFEVVPFMLAMNTGHKGLMSTIHANSGADALSRMALLFSLYSESRDISFELVTKLACKNIDYVIHLENKNIKEIIKVIGSEGETPFYEMIYESL